jgi:hypothetical protein
MAYSEVTVTGFNANPPEDDGTAASTNEISWQKHLDKIGSPLKTAIEATQTNITSLVDNQLLGVLNAPATTRMFFQQTTPPTGWTKETSGVNDKALRLVSGSVVNGGSTAFSSVFAARTILQANLPSVNLTVTDTRVYTVRSSSASVEVGNIDANENVANDINANLSMASPNSGSITAALGGSGTAMDFAVAYMDVVLGIKDA